MPALTFLADAPESFVLSSKGATSQVQIAKTGSFRDPRYGKFKITPQDFARWIANFNSFAKSPERLGLPVDVDHSPEKTGDTEAAGWITSLEVRNGGTELWATAEWNTLGQELVRDRRYAYLSPSYVNDYKDEQGKSHGTALVGVGLTNRPFLTMATVSLSKTPLSLAEEVEDVYTLELTMPDLHKIAEKLSLGKDADEATILSKVDELIAKPESTQLSVEDQAKREGKIVLAAANFVELSAGASAGKEALKTLSEMKFESTFDKALKDPKGARVTPGQKDIFLSLYQNDPENTLKILDSLPHVVQGVATGAGAEGAATGGVPASLSRDFVDDVSGLDVDATALAIHARAVELESSEKMSYVDAVAKAESEGVGS